MKYICLLFMTAACAFGQTPAQPTVNSFSLALSPISLPGNHQTVAGTEAGLSLQITKNFSAQDTNILAPGSNFQFFGGCGQYDLPVISTALNNASPNLDGLKFKFSPRACLGTDRLTLPAGTQQHWGFTAGMAISYSLNNTWAFGGQVEYGHFPGFNQRAVLVSVGPQLHF